MIAPALGLAPNVTVPASHLANGVVPLTVGVVFTVTAVIAEVAEQPFEFVSVTL